MLLGQLVDLKAKAGGEKSMSEKRGHWKTLTVSSCKTRVIRRKLDRLNPNLQRCDFTLAATASLTQRPWGRR